MINEVNYEVTCPTCGPTKTFSIKMTTQEYGRIITVPCPICEKRFKIKLFDRARLKQQAGAFAYILKKALETEESEFVTLSKNLREMGVRINVTLMTSLVSSTDEDCTTDEAREVLQEIAKEMRPDPHSSLLIKVL